MRPTDEQIEEWRQRHHGTQLGKWCTWCESVNCEAREILDALAVERDRADKAEARIAAVSALLDERRHYRFLVGTTPTGQPLIPRSVLLVEDVRSALDSGVSGE
jgi:mRNA-degrading endonuclease toxin of MazEF toxin-antitoxin module